MNATIERLKRLLAEELPQSRIKVDEPEHARGNLLGGCEHWQKAPHTLEYRRPRKKASSLFPRENAGYGEGPAEIYRTPERATRRLAQLMSARNSNASRLGLKDIRELYGQSQVTLAKKAGVKQPAISRFEKRGEVKLSTLAATIKALGGKLEVRTHFEDADVPISLLTSKR